MEALIDVAKVSETQSGNKKIVAISGETYFVHKKKFAKIKDFVPGETYKILYQEMATDSGSMNWIGAAYHQKSEAQKKEGGIQKSFNAVKIGASPSPVIDDKIKCNAMNNAVAMTVALADFLTSRKDVTDPGKFLLRLNTERSAWYQQFLAEVSGIEPKKEPIVNAKPKPKEEEKPYESGEDDGRETYADEEVPF